VLRAALDAIRVRDNVRELDQGSVNK